MRAIVAGLVVALSMAPALVAAHHGDTLLPYVDASGHFVAGLGVAGVGALDDGDPVPDAGVGPISLARIPFAVGTHPCHPDLQILLTATENATAGTQEAALIVPYRFQLKLVDASGATLPGAVFDFEGSGSARYPLPPEHARGSMLTADLYMLVGADATWALGIRGWLQHEGCVLVSEVEANPGGADAGNEWVELANLGFGDVDVSGWTIRTTHGAPAALTLPAGTTIAGGGRLVVTFPTQFLDNEDEVVVLEAVDGVELARTPALSDGADDARTHQLAMPDGATWAFLAGTPGS